MLGQAQAIAKRPPHLAASGHPMQVKTTAILASPGFADTVLNGTIPFGGCWVTFTASVDCYIFFNSINTGLPAPSATNSFTMTAGVEYNWWVNDTDDGWIYFCRAGANDGVLTRYRSNL